MNICIQLFTSSFVLLLSLIMFSSSALALDLNDIIHLAISRDAKFQADRLRAEAKNADGWQSVAGYGPTLSVSGTYMESRDSTDPQNSSEVEGRVAHFQEPGLTIGLEQPVIDLEKASNVMRGKSEMAVAELLLKKSREELLLRVHERYYAILSSRENLRLAQAESAALLKHLQTAKEKLDLGFGTITDQYDSEARYRLSLAAEIANQNEYENGLHALEEIIGQEFDEEIDDFNPDMVLPLVPHDIVHWLEQARHNNTDLALKRVEADIAQLGYRANQSRFLPSLVFFADYNERHPDDGLFGYGEERTEADVGVRLEVSLLAGGRDTAATIAASKRADAARVMAIGAQRAVDHSLRSLWNSINNTRLFVEAYKQAVAANEKALKSTRESYEEGVKVLLDVLNSQQEYFRSLEKYKSSRYEYMILLEKFRQVVGVELVVGKQAF